MHLQPTLFALLGAASAMHAASAEAQDNTIAALSAYQYPKGTADIDLDDLAAEGIIKRKAITYCANQQYANGTSRFLSTQAPVVDRKDAGDCKPLEDIVSGTLAAILKGKSKNKECGKNTGTVAGVSYSLYTAPSANCDTTAERGTIEGGLNRYFDYLGGQICGVHCVRLNHGGGTYRAYITLGPEGANLDSVDCSSTDVYIDCGNGGQNDS
jgi:hypothetical protein